MLRVFDLKLTESTSWSAAATSFEDWFVVSVLDTTCNSCNSKLLIITQEITNDVDSSFKFLCVGCCNVTELAGLNLKHQHVFVDRLQLMKEVGIDLVAGSFADLMRLLNGYLSPTKVVAKSILVAERNESKYGKVTTEQLRKGEDDSPIPKGYRSVAWIRLYEAHAIKYCHENKKDHTIKNDNGEVVLECKYFSNDSFEVKKFKSNVQAIRVNGENRRVIGWIRNEEARAIIIAERERRDVEFSHISAGKGGLVQFFAENLEVARKYRSTTRLLRLD